MIEEADTPVEKIVKRARPVRSGLLRNAVFVCASAIGLMLSPAAFGEEIPFEMYDDPKVEIPEPTLLFSAKFVPLWTEALEGPEVDLKRQAADTVILAQERGMPELEGMIEPLRKVLGDADPHPLVSLAAARALVALDARQAADELFDHARTKGSDVAQVVEPAFASWDYKPIRPVWLERLDNPQSQRRRLMLAIDGLAGVKEPKAEPRLLELARSRSPGDVRLAAARALGRIRPDGLNSTAAELAVDKSPQRILERLVAASMIAGHRDEASVKLMMELAVDLEPAVAAIALATLLEIDPDHVLRIVEVTIANPDANVRRLGAEALVARPAPERVRLLGPMLDDPHPDLRRYIRQSLRTLAGEPQLAKDVIDAAMEVLATDRWRGLEQASLLLTELDHKPAVDRLIELLEFGRPEVFIAAAWALGQLAVAETFSAMLEKARVETQKGLDGEASVAGTSTQVCHLLQALGRLQYAPCDEVLRHYIPKDSPFAMECRMGAIWALGHLYADKPDEELAGLLRGRLSDLSPMAPECEGVRQMSAVSLGRMKSEKSLETLREFDEPQGISSPVGFACSWAIAEITGEPMTLPLAQKKNVLGWFLTPLDP